MVTSVLMCHYYDMASLSRINEIMRNARLALFCPHFEYDFMVHLLRSHSTYFILFVLNLRSALQFLGTITCV